MEIPLADFRSPDWDFAAGPVAVDAVNTLDLRSVGTGEFELWLDNVAFAGDAGTDLVDDFDDGDLAGASGTWWWAEKYDETCAACDGSTAVMEIVPEAGRGEVAHVTIHNSLDGCHSVSLDISAMDLTQYDSLRFDVRITGTARVQARLGDAQYQNNADCPPDENFMVKDSCGIDQGMEVPPYTDGFAVAAPDLGAYETAVPAWTAGAAVTEDIWDSCAMSLPEAGAD